MDDRAAEFDRIMLSFYRNRYEDVQKVNRMLWDFSIELVRAIDAAEHDGSSTKDLKETGERITGQLRGMLERGIGI